MNDTFSVESILFKDSFKNTSSNTVVNTSKSMDELVYDAYKSEEDLKFYETYTMINDYNTNQKLRMLKRLNNVTNKIKNRNINNSCESYLNSIMYSIEEDNDNNTTTDGSDSKPADTKKSKKKKNFLIRFFEKIAELAKKFASIVRKVVMKFIDFISRPFNKKSKDEVAKLTGQNKEKDAEIAKLREERANERTNKRWNDLMIVAEKYGMAKTNDRISILTFDGLGISKLTKIKDTVMKNMTGISEIIIKSKNNTNKDVKTLMTEVNQINSNIKPTYDEIKAMSETTEASKKIKFLTTFFYDKPTPVHCTKNDFENTIEKLRSEFSTNIPKLKELAKKSMDMVDETTELLTEVCTNAKAMINANFDKNLERKAATTQMYDKYSNNMSLVDEIYKLVKPLNTIKNSIDKGTISAITYFTDLAKVLTTKMSESIDLTEK